jgi:hypothetical protein
VPRPGRWPSSCLGLPAKGHHSPPRGDVVLADSAFCGVEFVRGECVGWDITWWWEPERTVSSPRGRGWIGGAAEASASGVGKKNHGSRRVRDPRVGGLLLAQTRRQEAEALRALDEGHTSAPYGSLGQEALAHRGVLQDRQGSFQPGWLRTGSEAGSLSLAAIELDGLPAGALGASEPGAGRTAAMGRGGAEDPGGGAGRDGDRGSADGDRGARRLVGKTRHRDASQ